MLVSNLQKIYESIGNAAKQAKALNYLPFPKVFL